MNTTHSAPIEPAHSKLSLKSTLRKLTDKNVFLLLAETFQAMGDSSRIQIIWSLAQGELSVTELTDLLEMSQPTISHHLRTLRNLKLVRVRKDGRTSYYSLDDHHINHLLKEGMEHVKDFV